ncbi:hypothetical protein UFOVP836_17 [uncultured Caudovirales phage]|uniref:Uncharacterized protein n=1 Tax=uncultured Caudovirales phage TaxID=2100421 RepID=A0A6J5P9U3_9CAUD|nr:hypothetical protein UFOVP836_17 [uncultured Caudovirales phage]
MTAAELEALAERLMHGEYTTADLHAAARCARGCAKAEKAMTAQPGGVQLIGYRGRAKAWSWLVGPNNGGTSYRSTTALEAVEAAEVGK